MSLACSPITCSPRISLACIEIRHWLTLFVAEIPSPSAIAIQSRKPCPENMSFTLNGKSFINHRRDVGHQRVQQFGRLRVVSKVRTLPGPHRDEFLSAGLLCQAGDIPHEEALERIWQDFHARRVHRIEQLVLDAACEPSCEATSQRRLARLTAEQGLAMLRTRPGLLAGEERRPDLHAFRTEGECGDDASGVGDAARRDDGTDTRSATCGTSENVPVSESSDARRNDPRCPPASKPEATITSTFAFCNSIASSGVVAVPMSHDALGATFVQNLFRRDAVDETERRHFRVDEHSRLLFELHRRVRLIGRKRAAQRLE